MLVHDGPVPVETPRKKKKRRGATSIEYAFMLTFIIVVCIVAIQQVGQATRGIWGDNSTKIEEAGSTKK